MGKKPVLIVAGPTCSGKSALALHLAESLGGAVINADAMQVYKELRVLTARPTAADEARAPHYLYGVRPAAEASTVAWWRAAALDAMAAAAAAGRVPILCGGTGLYLQSLTQGLAAIPEPSPAAREEARALLGTLGAAGLHARLAVADAATAAKLRPSDGQRIARAWEVWRSTGRGLAEWQSGQARSGNAPPAIKAALHAPAGLPAPDAVSSLPWRFFAVLLDPPRLALRGAIAQRFDAMLAAGALAEVRALLAQNLPTTLPAMRAHGVPELSAYVNGTLTLEEAAERTRLVTGQYTKRQATWFRHRHIADTAATHRFLSRFDDVTQFPKSMMAEIVNFIYATG